MVRVGGVSVGPKGPIRFQLVVSGFKIRCKTCSRKTPDSSVELNSNQLFWEDWTWLLFTLVIVYKKRHFWWILNTAITRKDLDSVTLASISVWCFLLQMYVTFVKLLFCFAFWTSRTTTVLLHFVRLWLRSDDTGQSSRGDLSPGTDRPRDLLSMRPVAGPLWTRGPPRRGRPSRELL